MKRFLTMAIPVAALLITVALLILPRRDKTVVLSPGAAQNSERRNDVDVDQERTVILETQLADARVEAAQSEQKARALAAALATNRTSTASAPNLLKDPETRRTMEKQQLQALDRRIKQLVNANLVAKLNLAPDQAARLRELLRNKQAPAMELMTALMAGDLDEARIAETGTRVNQQIAEAEAEIRKLLGPERYSEFERREKSDVERNQLRELKNQFTDAGHPLRSDQQEQLLAAMYDERQRFQFQINFHDPSSFDYTRFRDYFNEANLERFYTEMQDLNGRIVARAEPILDAEQLADFERGLQDHLERGRATVRMTQALFPIKKP